MILTAHQPVYLPWLGLLHKIAISDVFVSFNQVQYLPRDWNNRNRIKTPNGPMWLTVPVLTKNKFHQKINEVRINNTLNWRHKHWRSIYLKAVPQVSPSSSPLRLSSCAVSRHLSRHISGRTSEEIPTGC